jgi:hypothetical protein
MEDIPRKAGADAGGSEPADTKLSRKSWVTPKVITSTLKDGTEAGVVAGSDATLFLS